MSLTTNDYFFDLPRPQYTQSPELLATALAWELVALPDGPDTNPRGFVFLRRAHGHSHSGPHQTGPRDDHGPVWDHWLTAIKTSSLSVEGRAEASAKALLVALRGVEAPKAKSVSAVPVTQSAALLQDTRGLMGAPRPPDFAKIIRGLYALGGGGRAPELAWRDGLRRATDEPFFRALDAAIRGGLWTDALRSATERTPPDVEPAAPAWLDATGDQTPFRWFKTSWDRLCRERLSAALPPRRWVDWATTVLRTAVGFGYLWEWRFYDVLRSAIYNTGRVTDREVASMLVGPPTTTVPWVSTGAISARDVTSRLKSYAAHGLRMKLLLDEHLPLEVSERLMELRSDPKGLPEVVSILRDFFESVPGKAAFTTAMGAADRKAYANAWETVKYALTCREHSGPAADHYGFLVPHGRRWSLPNPGTEWIAAIATLCVPDDSPTTRLSAILKSLQGLGLEVSVATLTAALEKAGLSRSSHDADEALEVARAF